MEAMETVQHNWIYIGTNAYEEYTFVPGVGVAGQLEGR
jgi:hypothetical protein